MKTKKLFLVVILSGLPLFLNACFMIKWFANPQSRVEISLDQYAKPTSIVGKNAIVYSLINNQKAKTEDEKLLAKYAPIIVQGIQDKNDEDYPGDSDLIGNPELIRNIKDDIYEIVIDTKAPVLFTRISETLFRGKKLKQLEYHYWYPRHPVGGIQVGEVDSGILRITLTAKNTPAVYEHVFACGCYHGSFIPELIESWAKEEFKTLSGGKKHFTERLVEDEINWVVRDLVKGEGDTRPILFISAGSHLCLAIQTKPLVENLNQFEGKSYHFAPYENLEKAKVLNQENKTASIYRKDGFIWGGRRGGEEWVFTSMDHPGWPRRFELIEIHWDEQLLSNEKLIDTFLRLPRKILEK